MKILFKNKIKKNFFTSSYFIKTKKLLNCNVDKKISVLQFICFNDNLIKIAGILEVIELIKKTIPKNILKQIKVYGVKEGSEINKSTPILKIIGDYKHFCFLENIIDGILSRRSSVCTNCWYAIKELKNDQKIIFMCDRTDDYFLMPYDGYAASVAGINIFCAQAHVQFLDKTKNQVIGTIPHALIQQYNNDLNKLIVDYYNLFNTKPTILLDFNNDVINELNKIKKNLDKVFAIRLDTSKNILDKSLEDKPHNYGVSNNLIKLVNDWLINNNFKNIKIIISSHIDNLRIKEINNNNLKVDYFGIGTYFQTKSVHITADLVSLNNKPCSKFGRQELFSSIIKRYI